MNEYNGSGRLALMYSTAINSSKIHYRDTGEQLHLQFTQNEVFVNSKFVGLHPRNFVFMELFPRGNSSRMANKSHPAERHKQTFPKNIYIR